MSEFDDDVRLEAAGEGAWAGHVRPCWNIGTNPNGGYLLALAFAALRRSAPDYPDPLSVTVHYLKPGLSDRPCRIVVQRLSAGRTLVNARATLLQDETPRLEVIASLGDLGDPDDSGVPGVPGVRGDRAAVERDGLPALAVAAPAMPAPEHCTARSADEQGVALPILERVDVRLHPDEARGGAAGRAQVSGWIRFRDGRAPDTLASLLFADAFPPAVFGLLGVVGWVPTVALTVQVRRRPVAGWMLGQFRTVDMAGGRLVEDGLLWDADGRLVAQSRQLALVRVMPQPPAARG